MASEVMSEKTPQKGRDKGTCLWLYSELVMEPDFEDPDLTLNLVFFPSHHTDWFYLPLGARDFTLSGNEWSVAYADYLA